MIYALACDRRRFVDFLLNQKPIVGVELKPLDLIKGFSLGKEDLLLIWQRSPQSSFALPNAVIVLENELSDFLAWVLTYFRQFRPFTAHCRIITPFLYRLLAEPNSSCSKSDIRSADVGLILAEGISYTLGHKNLGDLPFSAYSRTLSYAFSEALGNYKQLYAEDHKIAKQIINGWLSVRELSNQPKLNIPASTIGDIWAMILKAVSKNENDKGNGADDELLIDSLKGVWKNGQIPNQILSEFFHDPKSIFDAMEGSLEGRVQVVDSALKELLNGKQSARKYSAFLAGYLTSRIQPGTLDHFPVLAPYFLNFRESYLWYGVCSGLSPGSSVNDFGNGKGWLMKRELERSLNWLDRPNCDIALSEMKLILQNKEGGEIKFPRILTDYLKVEIFPLVSTSIKWTGFEEDNLNVKYNYKSINLQAELFEDDCQVLKQYIEQLFHKIDDSSKSLYAIRKEIETKFGHVKNRPKRRKK